MRPTPAVLSALAGLGGAMLGYASLVEPNMFTLRRFEVPVLAAGAKPLRVLHLSDLHMTAGQRRKQDWVRRLDDLDPDLVITTGDNLAGHDAVLPTLSALAPLLERPGAFVLGSNDYWAPRPKNPLRYFKPDHKRVSGIKLPWQPLRDAMLAAGWLDLTNARGELEADQRRIAFAGVDDPHLRLDRYARVAGDADPDADLRIGLTHSPEPRVVNSFAADGTTWYWPATRTGASFAFRSTGHWSPTAVSTGRALGGCTAGPPEPGCTSRPGWAARRTRRFGSPVLPRPPC